MIPVKPLIFADFQNADSHGRVRLNTAGTLEDLSVGRVVLSDGLLVTLYTDDGDTADGLRVDGTVERNEEGCWVAVVDWSAVRRTDETPTPVAVGRG